MSCKSNTVWHIWLKLTRKCWKLSKACKKCGMKQVEWPLAVGKPECVYTNAKSSRQILILISHRMLAREILCSVHFWMSQHLESFEKKYSCFWEHAGISQIQTKKTVTIGQDSKRRLRNICTILKTLKDNLGGKRASIILIKVVIF